MPAPIIIEVTPQARAVIAKLRRFPEDMGRAIKRGMDDAGNTAWREITIKRFSGKGPYPVSMHKLGEVSERTKQGLMWRTAQVSTAGNQVAVTGAMGVFGVKYFPLHEQGSSFMRQFKRAESAKKAGRATRSEFITRRVRIPARAPLRTGIKEHKINFQQKIQQELEKEWAKKQ